MSSRVCLFLPGHTALFVVSRVPLLLHVCVFVCRPLCQRSCLYKATESWIIDAGRSSQHALSLTPAILHLTFPYLLTSPPVIVIVVIASVNNHKKNSKNTQARLASREQKGERWLVHSHVNPYTHSYMRSRESQSRTDIHMCNVCDRSLYKQIDSTCCTVVLWQPTWYWGSYFRTS